MTTYCDTDPRTPPAIRIALETIEAGLGQYRTTDRNPCGGAAYYDKGEKLPWRLLYCDGSEHDRFATWEEALEAAVEYEAEMSRN